MSTIYVILSIGSYTPVRGRAPVRIQSLRAFRRSAPRLSLVGRCLDFKAVGLFGELLYCPGHQVTSEAHRRWVTGVAGELQNPIVAGCFAVVRNAFGSAR